MKKKLTLILTLVLLAIAAALVVRAIRGSHTLKDTSEPELIRAYYDGAGWAQVDKGVYKVWSSDRSMEYTMIGDKITVRNAETDDAREYFVAYVGGKVDVEELTTEYLVDLIRSGDWNGRWLYCPASGQLAKNTGCGLVLYQDGAYWETSVFPAIGYDELPYQRAWRDSETGWTFYASEQGIGAWRDDGTPAGPFEPVVEFDPENAFVFFGSYSNRAAYAGDGKIFRITFGGEFELMFDDFARLHNEFGNYWTFSREDGSEWNMYGRPEESMDTQEAYDYGIGVDDRCVDEEGDYY